MVSLRQAYDESENPVVSTIRSVTDTIGSWFDENETAQVMRLMKSMDPAFNREGFERDLREYIVPEVVDAYLSADKEALKAWCGEAVRTLHPSLCQCSDANCQTYNVLWATMEHFLHQGLISDSKVLDIRQVDVCRAISSLLTILTYSQVSDGKILENEVPVFIITFATQEVLLFRNAKSGETVVGAENKVEQCTYVAAITRVPEDLSNEITGGWKVIEVHFTLLYAAIF